MDNFEKQNSQEHGVKRSDELRMELSKFPKILDPFEEWSNEERKDFFDWCSSYFNNLYSTVGGVLDENSPLFSDTEPTHSHSDSSEKYKANTYAEFYKNIRQALVNRGIDISLLRERLANNQRSRKAMFADPKKFSEDQGLINEKIDNMAQFYLAIIPAVYDLLDSGYSKTELAR